MCLRIPDSQPIKNKQSKMMSDQTKNEALPQGVLLDGSPPLSSVEVEALLERLGIASSTISHEPMRTVEDSKKYRDGVPGGYSKNLFLRNKKGKMWLVTLHEDRQIDLRDLGTTIEAGRVSFASSERLMQYLGVIPGAVTPLAVANDKSGQVQLVIDKHLMLMDPLHFHPCDNSKTTSLNADGLLRFLDNCDHTPQLIDLGAMS